MSRAIPNNKLFYTISVYKWVPFIICLMFHSFKIEAHPYEIHSENSDTSHMHILIAAEPNYAPYCYINKNGEAEGFAIDLFKAAANAVNLDVTIKIGIWSEIREELKQGRIDALPLVGKTPERENLYDFSMPYLSLHGAVFVRKNDVFKDRNDLMGKEVLVMRGDNAEEFIRREKITDKITLTNTFQEAFAMLSSGEGDFIITQHILGLSIIDQLKLRKITRAPIDLRDFSQDFCFAVSKGNIALRDRLNEGLSILIANGTYEQIRSQWFGPSIKEKISYYDVMRITGFTALIVSFVLGILFIIFLRRQVKIKTADLNEEIVRHQSTLRKVKDQQNLIQESESKMRLLLNSTAEGIFSVDLEGYCTLINSSAMNMLKYEDENEILGKNIHTLIHSRFESGEVHSESQCKIFQAIRSSQSIHIFGEVFWRKDGSSFYVEYFAHPIVSEGDVLGAVVTFWDYTETKRNQDDILALNERLESEVAERTRELDQKVQKLNKSQQAMLFMVQDLQRITNELESERQKLLITNRELDAFAYSVSHDLRTPLRAIDGFSKFLNEDYNEKLDSEGQRMISVIRENTRKMDELISSLLNFSRITRTELRKVPINMGKMAEEVYSEISSDQQKVEFIFSMSNVENCFGDHLLIRQVWVNLIENALKYSALSECKKIEIQSMNEKDTLIYSVKDCGAGFNPQYSDKLFGVFQRLHASRDFEGTGIGLAIVQRIINKHEGKVWADGKPGEGACFYFSLPNNGLTT